MRIPARANGRDPRRRVLIGVFVLTAFLLAVMLLPDFLLNSFAAPALREAVEELSPGSSTRIGHLRYNLLDNAVTCDSLRWVSPDSSMLASSGAVSLAGIDWLAMVGESASALRACAASELRIGELRLDLPASGLQFRLGRLRLSLGDSTAHLDSLAFQPTGTDEEFFRGDVYRKTRVRAFVPGISVEGLAVSADGAPARISVALVTGMDLKLLMNKWKPPDTSSTPLMLPDALSSLQDLVLVDSLVVSGGTILYAEQSRRAARPGEITFDSVQALVAGVSGDTARFQASAVFMKGAEMDLAMSVPVEPGNLSFRCSGSLGRMGLSRLNPWMVAVDNTRLTGGTAHGATFEVVVQDSVASGTVMARYEDLGLDVLDEKTKRSDGFDEELTAFVANTFVLQNTNMPDRTGYREAGRVRLRHPRNDEFMSFLWKAVKKGLGEIVGFG